MADQNQKVDARFIAIKVLVRVIQQGESLNTAMPRENKNLDERERPLLQALVYGVLRWRWQLEGILKPYLKKSIRNKDLDVQIILLLGIYQLLWLRTPDYAAVDAAVKSSLKIKKQWAKGLVNAVLRQVVRDREKIDIDDQEAANYSHPAWLLAAIKADWPDDWQQVVEQGNLAAPMSLRVDTQQENLNDYIEKLNEVELDAEPLSAVPTALVLDQASDVHRLPGFEAGAVSVQDPAAQLAAHLIKLAPQQRVLDACAAPGGKTVHMLQTEPTIELDAVDISESRLQRVEENLERVGLHANLIAADIIETKEWWNGRQYDRILLDAPCSATGVIRRHPDIKSLRWETDIDDLVQTQAEVMAAVWPLLKPGGLMLYATCSILKAENESQVLDFLAKNNDAKEISITADWGRAQKVGRQILTGDQQMDGFYYALLEKLS